LEWEAFNAGNDVCALLKCARRHSGNSKNANPRRIEIAIPLMKCKHKVGILGGNHIVEEELDLKRHRF
jgi:hypothetical protein